MAESAKLSRRPLETRSNCRTVRRIRPRRVWLGLGLGSRILGETYRVAGSRAASVLVVCGIKCFVDWECCCVVASIAACIFRDMATVSVEDVAWCDARNLVDLAKPSQG